MVGGMGGLSNNFSDLIDGQEKMDMMDPSAIVGNLAHAGMIKGAGQGAIGGGSQPRAIAGGPGT